MSKLVNESVFKTITKMAVPMLAGTFAMNMYNLTDAWFVSRLGTQALAAISFTFPVIMFYMLLIRGIAAGAMTLVAHAIGGKDHKKAAILTTHSLVFCVLLGLVICITGMFSVDHLFSKLGASGEVLGLTTQYMNVWYLGAVIMVIQMVSSDIIIGTGNTKAVSSLMVSGTVINAILDYMLIFGKLGMPKLGISGAAIATVIAQFITLLAALYLLSRKSRLICFEKIVIRELVGSWISVLKFGIPGALGMILTPIASALIVALMAKYGDAAVAASGVATRIEMFAFMIPMTVGMSLIPFIAQNYGAMRLDRIKTARKGTMIFALLYGVFIAIVFLFIIDPIASIFSNEKAVIDVLRNYIFITCAGYGLLEVHRYSGFCMTGVHEPVKSSLLNCVRVILILIPLSIVGEYLFKLNGIFWGRLATDIISGCIGIMWSKKILDAKEKERKSCNSNMQLEIAV